MPATASAPTLVDQRTAAFDLDQFQGAWESVAGPRPARLLIAGNRFCFEFRDGDIFMGEIFLDAREEPRQMDMLIEEGPFDAKGLMALCIYHLSGDVLRWCPTKPGTDRRLSGFPSVHDDRYNSMVFKRARARRSR
jgi:uncharacterized protein (TIGR03067 family)